jgi:hypothetical protein
MGCGLWAVAQPESTSTNLWLPGPLSLRRDFFEMHLKWFGFKNLA